MVSLSRFTDLHDRAQTEIFTFIVPKTILSEYHSEVHSKDFTYAYQRWYITFSKTLHHLCCSLHLRTNASPNCLTVTLDFTLLLHNREHFSRNEMFTLKECAFTAKSSVQACPNFIELDHLRSRKFTDDQSEFIVDLILRNPKSVYEESIQLPVPVKGRPVERLETSYFAFGSLEWNLVFFPSLKGTMVKLNRMTHFEHNCRATFRLTIGQSGGAQTAPFVSSLLESTSDLSGTGDSISLNCLLDEYMFDHRLHVKLEMLRVNLLSDIQIPPINQSAQFYDRDKQAWQLQASRLTKNEQEFLRFKFFYTDVRNIPRDHLRYVSWKVYLYESNGRNLTKIETLGPFYKYYVQKDVDLSLEVASSIPIRAPDSQGQDGHVGSGYSLVIEWQQAHLLTPAQYHHYDDIVREQYHQMRTEFMIVQKECYELERKLLQYQHGVHQHEGSGIPKSEVANGTIPVDGNHTYKPNGY